MFISKNDLIFFISFSIGISFLIFSLAFVLTACGNGSLFECYNCGATDISIMQHGGICWSCIEP